MDHRASKDMISQGMSVKGEKTTEDLNSTQMGKVATPHNMMDAYRSMYEKKEVKEHHQKDADGNVVEHEEEINEIIVTGTLAALGGLAKAGGAALAAKGAVAAKGAAAALKTAKVTGLAAKAGKGAKMAGNVANVASLVPSGGDGGSTLPSGSRSGTLAAGNELDGDVIQELIDSGLFSEEELNELKKSTLGSYIAKGSKDLADRRFDQGDSEKRKYEPDKYDDKEDKKLDKREQGIARAAKKLSKEGKELADSGLFSKEEIKNLTEISADLALKASGEADKKRGKLAAAGDKEGAKAKASQASRLYAASGEKRKKEPVAIPDRSYPKGKGANYKE